MAFRCAVGVSRGLFALLVIVIGVLSALALVVVGLVEMPWPMLLLGLVATLYGFQYLIEGNRVQEIGIAAAEPVAESIGRKLQRRPAQPVLTTPLPRMS